MLRFLGVHHPSPSARLKASRRSGKTPTFTPDARRFTPGPAQRVECRHRPSHPTLAALHPDRLSAWSHGGASRPIEGPSSRTRCTPDRLSASSFGGASGPMSRPSIRSRFTPGGGRARQVSAAQADGAADDAGRQGGARRPGGPAHPAGHVAAQQQGAGGAPPIGTDARAACVIWFISDYRHRLRARGLRGLRHLVWRASSEVTCDGAGWMVAPEEPELEPWCQGRALPEY